MLCEWGCLEGTEDRVVRVGMSQGVDGWMDVSRDIMKGWWRKICERECHERVM